LETAPREFIIETEPQVSQFAPGFPLASSAPNLASMLRTLSIQGFPHAYELSDPTDHPTVLVFVHGWLLSRAYWQPVIDRLSPDFQCLSYDLRGFGASQATALLSSPAPELATVGGSSLPAVNLDSSPSSPLPLSYTPAAYATDLNLLLQDLNISRAWLVGHSLGGTIALWAADQNPTTIAGVTCVNSGGGIYLKEEFEKFRAAGQQIVKFRPRWLSYVPLLDLALCRIAVAQPLDRPWGKQRLLDLLTAELEAAIGTLLDSTTEAEVHLLPQIVARLSQPVHFIAGANDKVMEPKYVNHLASFHPSFECCGNNVTRLEDCGHLAMLERPEAVAAEIRRILALHP
jgi:2-succinyl-6-hydroxy-2,4-cyclohexadiene-1-carboxylate synthase